MSEMKISRPKRGGDVAFPEAMAGRAAACPRGHEPNILGAESRTFLRTLIALGCLFMVAGSAGWFWVSGRGMATPAFQPRAGTAEVLATNESVTLEPAVIPADDRASASPGGPPESAAANLVSTNLAALNGTNAAKPRVLRAPVRLITVLENRQTNCLIAAGNRQIATVVLLDAPETWFPDRPEDRKDLLARQSALVAERTQLERLSAQVTKLEAAIPRSRSWWSRGKRGVLHMTEYTPDAGEVASAQNRWLNAKRLYDARYRNFQDAIRGFNADKQRVAESGPYHHPITLKACFTGKMVEGLPEWRIVQ